MEFIRRTISGYKTSDLIYNNNGTFQQTTSPIFSETPAHWEDVLDANLDEYKQWVVKQERKTNQTNEYPQKK